MNGPRITLQACRHCGRHWHTPLPSCPFCASTDVGPEQADGRGKIYAWVVVHRSLESPPRPTPYTIITVDLDAGARVFGRYDEAEEPRPGEAVVCVAVDHERHDALTFRRL